jgi:Zn finger protein HypA/HybF involved in hydrogenase expression
MVIDGEIYLNTLCSNQLERGMHEIHFADRVLREARNNGARSFFRVEVGELCEITKEELEQGLKILTKNNITKDYNTFGNVVSQKPGDFEDMGSIGSKKMNFKVDLRKSKIKCKCGYIGRAKILDRGHGYCVWNCPKCGLSGKNVRVLDGGEIKVTEIE